MPVSPPAPPFWSDSSRACLPAFLPTGDCWLICLGILGAVLAKALLYYLHGILLSYLDWKMGCDIRARLTNRILSASFRSVERRDSGDLLNTLSTESWNATDALSVVLDIMVTACTLLVYIVLLLLISTKLTVLASAAMLCISLTVRVMTGRVKALGQLVKTENAVLATRMMETVEGNKTIRHRPLEPPAAPGPGRLAEAR